LTYASNRQPIDYVILWAWW